MNFTASVTNVAICKCLFFVLVQQAYPQTHLTGIIHGYAKLRRMENKSLIEEPATNLLILAFGQTDRKSTYTNDKGEFQFPPLKLGSWDILAQKKGFYQESDHTAYVISDKNANPALPKPICVRESSNEKFPPCKDDEQPSRTSRPLPTFRIRSGFSETTPKKSPGIGNSGKRFAQPKLILVLYQDESSSSHADRQPSRRRAQSTFTGRVCAAQNCLNHAEVTISVTSSLTNQLQVLARTSTDPDGMFTFSVSGLEPYDEYVFSVTREGYYPFSIMLDGADNPPSQIDLKPKVQSGGTDAASVQTGEPAHRHVFLPPLLEVLPISGVRSFDSLVFVVPGVLPAPRTSSHLDNPVTSGVDIPGQFSANGLRTRNNNFTVDGSDNNEEDIGIRRQGLMGLAPQTIESVQEFQLITILGDARFGRNLGAQVHTVSKSGTPRFHGSAYGFLTNDKLNARNFFDLDTKNEVFGLVRPKDGAAVLLDGSPVISRNPSEGEDPFTRSMAGFTLGGPLKQERTFFFVSWERQDIHASRESHFAVPSVKQRGLFETGDSGFCVANCLGTGSRFFPSTEVGNAIFSLFPFPNNPLGPYRQNNYTVLLPADGEGQLFSVKLDHKLKAFGKSHTITGRFNLGDEESVSPILNGALFSSVLSTVRTQNFAHYLNSDLSSYSSNTVRFSYGRTSSHYRDPFRNSSDLQHRFLRDPQNRGLELKPREKQFLINAPLLVNTTTLIPGLPSNPVVFSKSLASRCSYLDSVPCDLTDPGISHFLFQDTENLTGPIGQVFVSGFSPVGVDVYNFPQSRANNTFQVADTFTQMRTSHILNFGFDVRRTQINSTVDRNSRPFVSFHGLRNSNDDSLVPLKRGDDGSLISQRLFTGATLAALGVPTGIFQTLAVAPHSTIGLRFSQFNFFFQDEYQVNPNFRVTAGLRYELNTVPNTVGNQLEEAFDRGIAFAKQSQEDLTLCGQLGRRCQDLVDALNGLSFRVAFGGDRNNLAPRVGFAWNPAGSGKVLIRGGYGLYFDQFLGILINQSRNAFSDFIPINTATPRGIYLYNLANPTLRGIVQNVLDARGTQGDVANLLLPNTLNSLSGTNPVSSFLRATLHTPPFDETSEPIFPALNLVMPVKNLRSPYSQQYSMTIERQLTADSLFLFSYIGTRGVKLLRVSTPDFGSNRNLFKFDGVAATGVSYEYSPRGSLFPTGNKRDGFTISRTLLESSSSSTFHSFQIELRKRYSSGLQLGSAFTYSHTIDDASDFFDTSGAFALPQDSLQRSERSSANFDAKFRNVTHFVWEIPTRKKHAWLDGWQLSGILTFQSGQPFTVNSAIDVNRDGNLTDRLNTTTGLIIGPFEDDSRSQIRIAPGIDPADLLAPDGKSGAIGRNTFRATGIHNWDVAVSKRLTLGDRAHLQFRAEVFNLFNRTHFDVPQRILEFPAFGSATSTTIPARMVQFALKYQF